MPPSSPSGDAGRHDREVRSLLFVDAAEPDQLVTLDGGWLILVNTEVDSEFRGRCVSGVPVGHLGGVAVQAPPLPVEGVRSVLEVGPVLEAGDVGVELAERISPGRQ
jgi:hypothetical protein